MKLWKARKKAENLCFQLALGKHSIYFSPSLTKKEKEKLENFYQNQVESKQNRKHINSTPFPCLHLQLHCTCETWRLRWWYRETFKPYNIALNYTQFSVNIVFLFLFSEPIGTPTIIAAHNTSSNSIYLSWKSPVSEEIFGEFLGYRITYHARDIPENVNEILIRDSKIEVSIQHIYIIYHHMDSFGKHVSHCYYFFALFCENGWDRTGRKIYVFYINPCWCFWC